ncbi:MAG: nucleotidyltransferase domain-containing protein [Candidatus Nanohaloarchaea archaeon]
MGREQLEKDVKDFSEIDGVKAVLLFGSRVEGRSHSRSDWDICLVAPEKDPWEVVKQTFYSEETRREEYDVHAFEELPLKIKIRIVENHEVLFREKGFRLEEYLHRYRRIWNDTSKARGVS